MVNPAQVLKPVNDMLQKTPTKTEEGLTKEDATAIIGAQITGYSTGQNLVIGARASGKSAFEKPLTSLLDIYGAKYDKKELNDFLLGNRTTLDISITDVVPLDKEQQDRIEWFSKRYNIRFVCAAGNDLGFFYEGKTGIIAGEISVPIDKKDVEALAKLGLYVSITEDGRCYVVTEAGKLVQELAQWGIIADVQPGAGIHLTMANMMPTTMDAKTKKQVMDSLGSALELTNQGKIDEAMKIYGMAMKLVESCRLLERAKYLESTVKKEYKDVQMTEAEVAALTKELGGTDAFEEAVGLSLSDFKRLDYSLGRLAEYKLRLSQTILKGNVQVYSNGLDQLVASAKSRKKTPDKMNERLAQAETDARLASKVLADVTAITDACANAKMVEKEQEQAGAFFTKFKDKELINDAGVHGANAVLAIKEEAAKADEKTAASYDEAARQARSMAFYAMAFNQTAVYEGIDGANDSGYAEKVSAAMKKQASALNDAMSEVGMFKGYLAVACQFEMEYEKNKKEHAGLKKRFSDLYGFEREIVDSIFRQNDIATSFTDNWGYFDKQILDKYDPRSIVLISSDGYSDFTARLNENDAIIERYQRILGALDCADGFTWRTEKNEQKAREKFITAMDAMITVTEANGITTLAKQFSELRYRLKEKQMTVTLDNATEEYFKIMDDFGKEKYNEMLKESKNQFYLIKEIVNNPEKYRALSDIFVLFLRGYQYGPEPGITIDEIEAVLNTPYKREMLKTLIEAPGKENEVLRFSNMGKTLSVMQLCEFLGSISWESELATYPESVAAISAKPSSASAVSREGFLQGIRIMQAGAQAAETLLELWRESDPKNKDRTERSKLIEKVNAIQEKLNKADKKITMVKGGGAISAEEYNALKKELSSLYKELTEETYDAIILKDASVAEAAGWKVLKFLDAYGNEILIGSAVAGFIAGLFQGGLPAVAESQAARAGAKQVLNLARTYGARALKNLITKEGLKLAGKTMITYVGVAGRAEAAAAFIPMTIGTADYFKASYDYANATEGSAKQREALAQKQKSLDTVRQATGHMFKGVIAGYSGPARFANIYFWTGMGSEALTFAGCVLTAAPAGKKLMEGEKLETGEWVELAVTSVWVFGATVRPVTKFFKGFASVEGGIKTIPKRVGAGVKNAATFKHGVPGKFTGNDVFLTSVFLGDPLLNYGITNGVEYWKVTSKMTSVEKDAYEREKTRTHARDKKLTPSKETYLGTDETARQMDGFRMQQMPKEKRLHATILTIDEFLKE